MELTYGQLGGLNEAKREAEFDAARLLGGITFDLHEYNPRRRMRGVEAARVKVTDNGEEYLLWMSPRDIRDNLKLHGESKGLRDALEAYRLNAMPPNAPHEPHAKSL